MRNRDRVFEELYQEKKKNKAKTTTAEGSANKGTEGGDDKEKVDDEKNAPYLIAGFFHPYW